MASKFLSVCLNPTIQKTCLFSSLELNEVNRTMEYYTDASGKGINVSRVLMQLGADVCHLTHLGQNARAFLQLAAKDNIAIEWEDSGSEIRSCSTLLDRSVNTATEIVEESLPVGEGTSERILKTYRRIIYNYDWIIISGTKAAGYPDTIFPDMVALARELGKKVILDYRGKDLIDSLPLGPQYAKPNIREFVQTFLKNKVDEKSINSTESQKMIKRTMIDIYRHYKTIMIVTQGPDPVLFYDDGKIKKIQPDAITPVNPTGSGDAFTAGLAFSLSKGETLKNAVNEGIRCGALNAKLIRPGVLR